MKKARKGRSKLIFVLGGAASGKSQAALDLAGQGRPRAFIATGQAMDREMKVRIERTGRRRELARLEGALGVYGFDAK